MKFAEAPCPNCRRSTRFPLTDPPEDEDAPVTVFCECGRIYETELWIEWVPESGGVEA